MIDEITLVEKLQNIKTKEKAFRVLIKKYKEHLEWLRPLDPLKRATVGFESAIKFMMSTDNTHLIDTFWRKTNELDAIRTENILDTIPELAALK